MLKKPTYFGKYRGTVVQNADPEQIGRIQVVVPDIGGLATGSWAMPCLPAAGPQMGMFAVPPIGASVWVEFEHGDPDYPIWVGGFWGTAADVPALTTFAPLPAASIVFQTLLQNGLVISDVPGPMGGILLKASSGAEISINDMGITIANGKGAIITLIGPTVDINNGAWAQS